MRFLKMFLICFFSLMGVFAGTYGVMYAVGAFNTPKIEPEDLAITLQGDELGCYIDNGKIYAGQEFDLIITTTNEEVTQKNLTLSLEGVDSPAVEGKISDGVIRIPSTAKIGVPFKVEFIKTTQTFNIPNEEEVETEWIKGGISKIIIKSETNITLKPVSVDVLVDVPVYGMTLSAYPSTANSNATTEFAVGSVFDVKANFYPEKSRYQFSQIDNPETTADEAVYKTLYISQHVNETQYYERMNGSTLKENKFKCVKVGGVELVGYVLKSAIQQHSMEKVYQDANTINSTYNENEIYDNIRNTLVSNISEDFVKNSLDLNFVKVSQYSYTASEQSKEFKESTTFQYFANYESNLNSGNLEIYFTSDSNEISLQHEILNMSVSVVKIVEENKIVYPSANFSISGDSFYVAYQNKTTGAFITAIAYKQLTVSQKENYVASIVKSLDDVLDENKSKYMIFYSPKVSNNNINASLWELSIDEAGSYAFLLFYNNPDETSSLKLDLAYVDFSIAEAQSAPVKWIDNTEKELVIEYDDEGSNAKIKQYDLKTANSQNNIFIPQSNQYTTVRYFLYSETDANLTEYIYCSQVSISGYTDYDLYEIEDGIIKFRTDKASDCVDLEFNALFATVKTNAKGVIRLDNGAYIVDKISSSDNGEYNQAILFNVVDSLFAIEGELTVDKIDDTISPEPTVEGEGESQVTTKLIAFKQNVENIFRVTLTASGKDLLLDSEFHSNDMIELVARANGGTRNILNNILIVRKSDILIEYTFSTKPLVDDEAVNFNLYVVYKRTGKEFLISKYVLIDGLEGNTFNYLQVYPATAKVGYFGNETKPVGQEVTEDEALTLKQVLGLDAQEPKTVSVKIELTKTAGENTELRTTYKVDDLDVSIFDEEGNIIVSFVDAYDNDVTNVNYTLESSNRSVLVVQENKLSFVGTGSATLILKLGNDVVDKLNFVNLENSASLYKIDALGEQTTPLIDKFTQKNIFTQSEETEEDYSFEEIVIELYGVKGRTIDFTKETEELLKIIYAELNPEYDPADETSKRYIEYDLKSHIKYKLLSTNLAEDLLDMVSITENTDHFITGIEFKAHFARDARIRIEASIDEVKFSQTVAIIIKPNLSVSAVGTPETIQGVSAIDYVDNTTGDIYYGAYGGTNIKLEFDVSYVVENDPSDVEILILNDQVLKNKVSDSTNETFKDEFDFTKVTYTILVKVDGKTNSYSYNRNMNYYINPNVKIVIQKSTNLEVEGTDPYDYAVDLAKAIRVERIVGTQPFTTTNQGIIKEVIDKTVVNLGDTQSNISNFTDGKLYLSENVTTSKSVKIVYTFNGFNVRQGSTSSVNVTAPVPTTYYYAELNILPAITERTQSAFIVYNGKKYLALQEEKIYSKTDLGSYFKLVTDEEKIITFESLTGPDNLRYWNIDPVSGDITITTGINRIIGFNGEYTATLTYGGNKLDYPVMLVPFGYPMLAEGVNYLKDGVSYEITDLKNEIDINYLKYNDLYLSADIFCGQKIDLTTLLNSEFVSKFNFSVTNDNITDSKTYASISVEGSVKYLNTLLIGSDKYIILFARKGDAGLSVVEIPFRLKITSAVKMEVFYPYASKATDNSEYVYFDGAQTLQIDFAKTQSADIPNKSGDGKRFEIYINEEAVYNIYDQISYRVKSVNIGLEYATDTSKYATFNGSVLTINNYENRNAFTVVIEIILGDNITSKEYNITVSDRAETYSLNDDDVKSSSPDVIFDEINDIFVVNSKPEIKINGFKLIKSQGSVFAISNNELNFFIYGSPKIKVKDFTNGVLTIENQDSIVDIDATLVAYNAKGDTWKFKYDLRSSTIITFQTSLNADKKYTFASNDLTLLVDTQSVPETDILNIKLDKLVVDETEILPTNTGCSQLLLNYLNYNGTTSFVKIENDKELVLSPFIENSKLHLSVTFQFDGEVYTQSFVVDIVRDLASIYTTSGGAVESNITAGSSNVILELTDLFNYSGENYYFTYEVMTDANLINKENAPTLSFPNSANGGEVLVKVTATHKENSDYAVDSYIKYIVAANVKLTVSYPSASGETQASEIIASGYTLKLNSSGIFSEESKRIKVENNSVETTFTAKIKSLEYVSVKKGETVLKLTDTILHNDDLTFVVDADKTYGQTVFAIYYEGDVIGEYRINVRKTWADVLTPSLKNEDNTFNSSSNPETFFNGTKLDVASLDITSENLLKQYVFGYSETPELCGNKSAFNYNVSLTNNVVIPNGLFKCEIPPEGIIISENSDTNVTLKISTISGIEIANYYVRFAFDVKFNDEIVTLAPSQSGTIKSLYNIIYNDLYTQTIKKSEENDGKIFIQVYTHDSSDPTKWIEKPEYVTDYKNFITFEQNGTNIEAHGAPNTSIKVEFIVVISCGDNSIEKKLACIVNPNYDIEITCAQPYVIEDVDFAGNSTKEITLATSDIVTSLITVTREGSTQNANLLINSNLWTVSTPEGASVVASISSQTVKMTASRSTFGIKNVTITFMDKYDYEFTFNVRIIPAEEKLIRFKSATYAIDELATFDIDAELVNFESSMTIKIASLLLNEGGNITLENLTLDSNKAFSAPSVETTTSYTLTVIIDSAGKTTDISTTLNVRKAYELIADESYYKDGSLYLRDGERLALSDYYNVSDLSKHLVYGRRTLKDTTSFHISMTEDDKNKITENKIYVYQVPATVTSGDGIFINGNNEYSGDKITPVNVDVGEYRVEIQEIIDDKNAADFKYLLEIKYQGETTYTVDDAWQYHSVMTSNNNAFPFTADKNDRNEFKVPTTVKFVKMPVTYGMSQITIQNGYASSATEYFIPASESQFDLTTLASSNYFWSYDLFNLPKSFNANIIENYQDLVEDKIFTLESMNMTEDVTINFYGGKTLTIPASELGTAKKHFYSLRAKLGIDYDSNLELKTDGSVYRGISENDLKKIKNLRIDSAINTTVNIQKRDGNVWDYPNVTPLYQTNTFIVENAKIAIGSKEFGARTITYRALPCVINLSDETGEVVLENGYSKLVKTATYFGDKVSFTSWSSKVYVMSNDGFIRSNGNAQEIGTFKTALHSDFKFTFGLTDVSSTPTAEVNAETGEITLLDGFDRTAGHVSIDVCLRKTNGVDEVYTVKIGTVVVMPRATL